MGILRDYWTGGHKVSASYASLCINVFEKGMNQSVFPIP